MIYLFLFLFFYRNSNFLHLSSLILSSNLTISATKSLSFNYITHPLILGIEHFAKPTITLESIVFKESSSPLFYGKSVNLNLYENIFQHFYNETLKISDKSFLYSKLYFEKCFVTIERCIFDSDGLNEIGGAIEITKSSLLCRYSVFEYCSSGCGTVYGESSSMTFLNTNFSFCLAEDTGSLAIDSSNTHLSNCIFNDNIADNFSTVSVLLGSIFITKCYFINNMVSEHACVFMDETSGIIRSCEFYKNRCNLYDIQSAVICISNPRDISVIGCKFSENLRDYDYIPDHSVFTYGNNGTVKIRFCSFDSSVEYSVINRPANILNIVITNCQQDLNMNLFSKSIEEEISKFSEMFNANFSENLSLTFCILAVFGTIFMFLSIICIFSCIGISLF